MAWHLAPSLATLRAEVNTRWPRRDKSSDGTIGDTAHASGGRPENGGSDHNENSRGSVNAWDMDKDGVDVAEVIAAFERHPSARYWIFNRQIAGRDDGWRRRPYGGTNPHTLHVHFSIYQTRAAEQDTRSWGLLPVEEEMTPDEIKAAVVGGIHAALDQAATRSTPTGRQMGDDIAVLLGRAVGPVGAEMTAQRTILGQLVLAVAGVDEATKAQLQQELDALTARVAAVPGLTVEALGAVDSPEEIADRLRAVLGDKAAAVGALLAGTA